MPYFVKLLSFFCLVAMLLMHACYLLVGMDICYCSVFDIMDWDANIPKMKIGITPKRSSLLPSPIDHISSLYLISGLQGEGEAFMNTYKSRC